MPSAPRVRSELTKLDRKLLTRLLRGDSHAYVLSKAFRNEPFQTVDSALQKLKDADFIEAHRENNDRNVPRVVYALKPHIRELLEVDPSAGMEILHTALIEGKRHPGAEAPAMFAAAVKTYEAAHNVTFLTPQEGYIDGLFKYLARRANPAPSLPTTIIQAKFSKPSLLGWSKVLGEGPFYHRDTSGKLKQISVKELTEILKLAGSTDIVKGAPIFWPPRPDTTQIGEAPKEKSKDSKTEESR